MNKDHIVAQWQTVIEAQMHFNDMLLRTRSMGISVVLAAYGAAAIAFAQYPGQFIYWRDVVFHVSVPVVVFALLVLVSIFILDYFYYYQLLLASVENAENLEKEHSELHSLTKFISGKVSRLRAFISILAFYGIPLMIGIILYWYLVFEYSGPPTI